MNTPSAVLGGGVHGKVCWLIAYGTCLVASDGRQPVTFRLLDHRFPATAHMSITTLLSTIFIFSLPQVY